MSGINQMLTPHIQYRDMYPFLPAQISSLSCCGSLAADLKPFGCQRKTAGGLYRSHVERTTCGKCRDHTLKTKKSTMLTLLYLSHFITVLFSWMCFRSALRGCPLAESKDDEAVTFTVRHRAGNNHVSVNASGQEERASCGRVSCLFF